MITWSVPFVGDSLCRSRSVLGDDVDCEVLRLVFVKSTCAAIVVTSVIALRSLSPSPSAPHAYAERWVAIPIVLRELIFTRSSADADLWYTTLDFATLSVRHTPVGD